jgi:BirA family biotin operon repressor/biotin-[acetyl-CoA-carboxylase] ligase
VFEQLDSTNSLALSLANDPTHDGLVILAREQTNGRGQYGRSWHAPPGSSVLMSVLVFPPLALRRPALLTAWAAVSACETIFKLANLQATIKWPNDVLIAGKKVCGILIEQRTTSNADFPLASVAGIGLNVTQSAEIFAQANLPLATSLACVSRLELSFETVARELIAQLDQSHDLLHSGNWTALEAKWKKRLGLIGSNVIADGFHQQHRGRLIDVTFAGLDLEVAPGETIRLVAETIKHLQIAE